MASEADFLAKVDKSGFQTEGYVKRVSKPWGYELHLTTEDQPYMMKLLHINKDCRLSLQAHDAKSESWMVHSGKAAVIIEDAQGELVQIELKPGMGYTSRLGQRHRLVGQTRAVEILQPATGRCGMRYCHRRRWNHRRPDRL